MIYIKEAEKNKWLFKNTESKSSSTILWKR
jgi:hypothetical protein